MTYKLKFLPSAWKEWNKIGEVIREQFKKKLAERIENPIVPAVQLKGFKNYYKIKLRSAGYRLVYEVDRNEVFIYVITVGKRENDLIYKKVQKRTRKK
jgi:mRNA interferase RelE/StbE